MTTPRRRRSDRVKAAFAVWLIALGQVASMTGLGLVLEAVIRNHDHAPIVLTLSLIFGGQAPAAVVFRHGIAAGLEVVGPHLPKRWQGASE